MANKNHFSVSLALQKLERNFEFPGAQPNRAQLVSFRKPKSN